MDVDIVNKLYYKIQTAKNEKELKSLCEKVDDLYKENTIDNNDMMILYNCLMNKGNELAIFIILSELANFKIMSNLSKKKGTIEH